MPRPFSELTTREAREILESIVDLSTSERDLRRRLTKRGFDGDAAKIDSVGQQGYGFEAIVKVEGPRGEVIGA